MSFNEMKFVGFVQYQDKVNLKAWGLLEDHAPIFTSEDVVIHKSVRIVT